MIRWKKGATERFRPSSCRKLERPQGSNQKTGILVWDARSAFVMFCDSCSALFSCFFCIPQSTFTMDLWLEGLDLKDKIVVFVDNDTGNEQANEGNLHKIGREKQYRRGKG